MWCVYGVSYLYNNNDLKAFYTITLSNNCFGVYYIRTKKPLTHATVFCLRKYINGENLNKELSEQLELFYESITFILYTFVSFVFKNFLNVVFNLT